MTAAANIYPAGASGLPVALISESAELQIEGEPSVEQALFIWKDFAAEFADCLIGMRHLELGCQATAWFDQRALKLPGFIAA